MKKSLFLAAAFLLSVGAFGQSARTILDKAAAAVSHPSGVKAHFQMISKQFGKFEGDIAVKGNKFSASTPDALVWFDGKTQWTYMKQNEEVNVSNPTEAELQAINPYNFINIYKKGFDLSSKEFPTYHEVHLTPSARQRGIEEMYIIVDKQTSHPTIVKMRRRGKWSIIYISRLQKAALSDAAFRFDAKEFPNAEIIDLR